MMIDEKPTDEQLDRLENFFGFKVPRKHGYDVVRAIKAIHEEKIKVMFCMGVTFSRNTRYHLYSSCTKKAKFVGMCFYETKQRAFGSW